MRVLQATAVLSFVLVGIVGMVWYGAFLAFPAEPGATWVRTAGLVVLEAGIGLGGAAVIASIFRLMEGER